MAISIISFITIILLQEHVSHKVCLLGYRYMLQYCRCFRVHVAFPSLAEFGQVGYYLPLFRNLSRISYYLLTSTTTAKASAPRKIFFKGF